MKVAILGGTGFLGKYLIEYLKKEQYIPIVFTRNELDENLCECRKTDYSKGDLIEKLSDIKAVVHLAAKRGSQGLISEFHDNEVLTQNVYEVCSLVGISNIVYASSISVYSDKSCLPWSEKDIPNPKLMYGVSKVACEHIGEIYSNKKGLYIKNLRFAHLYGFNEKNNYMINIFFRRAFNKETLAIDTKSYAKREFLYAKDAAKSIICALNKRKISGIFNIGSEEAHTNFEVATIINSIFKNEDNLIIKRPQEDEKIEPSYMKSIKAEYELGFKPDYTFKQAVEEIYLKMKELDNVPLLY
ncbi:SDR family oxidoreductase [Paraclostridium ghonii]|uniref:UDP-glucose 4-epimerase n=1 Tax=Paraclostridium ghonii TaxID=29358 RepID=A0ABU0MW66_9FIRM|nr:NAD(P)-dependent oxidoreductase [Paeniclostridium ghonii]MDQ0555147.1 UDP-glucose 4-epimerase [Paeniclostridium ghonii]